MQKLAIIGSGDLGQQIAYHARADKKYEVVGFFDDFKENYEKVNGISILGKISDIINLYNQGRLDCIIIGIGYKHMPFRKNLFERFHGIVPFGTYIHSSCLIDKSSIVGKGSVIFPGCLIDQKVVIEENVLLNVGCCVAHDSIVGAHSFLSPRVAIAGFTKVGKQCILGINSTIIDNLELVDLVQLGAASVAIKNIDKPGLYVGNPIRFIRE